MAAADAAGGAALLRIEVVRSPRAGEVDRCDAALAPGASVADALAACGWTVPADCRVAVWGRLLAPDALSVTPLADCDRVELLRPLAVDPKEARRRRERTQRAARPGRSALPGTDAA